MALSAKDSESDASSRTTGSWFSSMCLVRGSSGGSESNSTPTRGERRISSAIITVIAAIGMSSLSAASFARKSKAGS